MRNEPDEKEKKTQRLELKITPRLADKLKTWCKTLRRSKTSIVEEALEKMLP